MFVAAEQDGAAQQGGFCQDQGVVDFLVDEVDEDVGINARVSQP